MRGAFTKVLQRLLDLFERVPVARPKSRALHMWTATVAILFGSFLSYIHHNGYPVFSTASLIAFGIAGLIGILFGALSTIHSKVMVVVAAGLGYLGAMLFGIGFPIFGATFLGSLVALKNVKGLGFVAVMFGFVGLTSPLRPQPAPIVLGHQAVGTNDLKPLIHIILDAHAPADYSDLGFSMWTDVNSISYRTVESLPDFIIGYPEKLEEKGYALEMWVSDFKPFCEQQCNKFRNHSLDQLRDVETNDRDWMVIGSFLTQVERRRLPYQLWALNSRRALEAIVDRANELGPGEAMLAHVIIPHSPYILDGACNLKPLKDWKARHHDGSRLAYDEQAACAKSFIARLPEDAIVIIQGDHGNRITDKELDDDPKAALNTLFAVRDGKRQFHDENWGLRDRIFSYADSLPSAD